MSAAEVPGTYLRNQVFTASREKLLLMLYDGAIRFIAQAESEWVEEHDAEKANYYLIRAQDIIAELMRSLNHEAGGEISNALLKLYDYMLRRLVEANVKKDSAMMDEVRRLLTELREAWQEAARKMLAASHVVGGT